MLPMLRRILALNISIVLALTLVLPVLGQNTPADVPDADVVTSPEDDFEPVWVATHSPTELRAAPEAEAISFGPVGIGFPLQMLQPQEGAWLLVFNPLTEGVAW